MNDLLPHIARNLPANLDERGTYTVDGKQVQMGFSDDHLFIIGIPAGVLRGVKKLIENADSPQKQEGRSICQSQK